MYTNTKSAYDKIDEMGGELPANKNLQNLAEAIRSIPTGPSLKGLKRALDNGTAQQDYPIGTTLEDEYNGQSNPLIVAQHLDSSNNSTYDGAEGVILIRKFVEPTSQIFGVNNASSLYNVSTIKGFLDTDYLDKCSDTLKSLLSEIAIQYYNGSSTTLIGNNKFFLMSDTEINSRVAVAGIEGFAWKYWKDITGLSAASSAANSGRIVKDRNGNAVNTWLRTRYDQNYNALYIYTNGGINGRSTTTEYGVLPACFIGKD